MAFRLILYFQERKHQLLIERVILPENVATWHFSRSVECSLFAGPKVLRGSFLAFASHGTGPEMNAPYVNVYKEADIRYFWSAVVLQPL